MHSKMYDKIKFYYDTGRWTIENVRQAVEKHAITPEEYEEITGEPYEE